MGSSEGDGWLKANSPSEQGKQELLTFWNIFHRIRKVKLQKKKWQVFSPSYKLKFLIFSHLFLAVQEFYMKLVTLNKPNLEPIMSQ